MEIINRIQQPTPKFFIKVRYIAFFISALGSSILNTVPLPAWLNTTLTIISSVASGIWGASFLPKEKIPPNHVRRQFSPFLRGDVTQ